MLLDVYQRDNERMTFPQDNVNLSLHMQLIELGKMKVLHNEYAIARESNDTPPN